MSQAKFIKNGAQQNNVRNPLISKTGEKQFMNKFLTILSLREKSSPSKFIME